MLCCSACSQNSTLLWESLSAAVMDEALRLHHTCIRAVAAKHLGYESATEGDVSVAACT